jgi:hypothetical protein
MEGSTLKILSITIILLAIALPVMAQTNYYAEVVGSDTNVNPTYGPTNALPLALGPKTRVPISAAEDAARITTISQARVDAAAAVAKTEKANIDDWSEKMKAFAKLTFKEINKLRVKNGDPEYTWDQFKTAMKAEL